jgi:hypothetical protein
MGDKLRRGQYFTKTSFFPSSPIPFMLEKWLVIKDLPTASTLNLKKGGNI